MHGVPSLSVKTGRGTLRENGPGGFVARMAQSLLKIESQGEGLAGEVAGQA